MAIGCLSCPDRKTCGGLHKLQDAFSCLDDCCGKPETCDGMCPNNLVGFRDHMREVNGLELDNLPRAKPSPAPPLPAYIPYIFHGNRRAHPLEIEAVALPLRLFYRANGQPKFVTRAEVEARFGICPATAIVLIGSGRDKAIEGWWRLSEHRPTVLASLRTLGVVLVTAPNYSMFTDEVRYNDMHAMKRIGMVWQEIVAGPAPRALTISTHVHRTIMCALPNFIKERRGNRLMLHLNFRTGAAWRTRLRLPCRRAQPSWPGACGASTAFGHDWGPEGVAEIAGSLRPDYVHRQLGLHECGPAPAPCYLGEGRKVRKVSELTLVGQPIDGLLTDNIAVMRSRVGSNWR